MNAKLRLTLLLATSASPCCLLPGLEAHRRYKQISWFGTIIGKGGYGKVSLMESISMPLEN
jgi:hypothetical protein